MGGGGGGVLYFEGFQSDFSCDMYKCAASVKGPGIVIGAYHARIDGASFFNAGRVIVQTTANFILVCFST